MIDTTHHTFFLSLFLLLAVIAVVAVIIVGAGAGTGAGASKCIGICVIAATAFVIDVVIAIVDDGLVACRIDTGLVATVFLRGNPCPSQDLLEHCLLLPNRLLHFISDLCIELVVWVVV